MASHAAIIGLKEETVDKLRELRRLNVESAKGFEEFAELVDIAALQALFAEIAHERREQAQTLGAQIEWNKGGESEEGGYAAAMRRAWVKVRDAFSSNSAATALSEAEHGEDVIKEAYEDLMPDLVDTPIYSVVAAQHANVKKTHDKIRDLRDRYKG